MTVKEIVPLDKRKSKVILDEGFTLVLYRGELKRFDLKEGEELSQEIYEKIVNEVLKKRARERVLFLLKASDKTEKELTKRLKEGFYPQEAIDYAIGFLKAHHYIDDEEYGRRYVEFHSRRKSRRQIQYELRQKGLSGELIEEVLREQPVDEEAQVLAYIRKKHLEPEKLEFKERRKVMAALGRKGFSYEAISRALGGFYEED